MNNQLYPESLLEAVWSTADKEKTLWEILGVKQDSDVSGAPTNPTINIKNKLLSDLQTGGEVLLGTLLFDEDKMITGTGTTSTIVSEYNSKSFPKAQNVAIKLTHSGDHTYTVKDADTTDYTKYQINYSKLDNNLIKLDSETEVSTNGVTTYNAIKPTSNRLKYYADEHDLTMTVSCNVSDGAYAVSQTGGLKVTNLPEVVTLKDDADISGYAEASSNYTNSKLTKTITYTTYIPWFIENLSKSCSTVDEFLSETSVFSEGSTVDEITYYNVKESDLKCPYSEKSSSELTVDEIGENGEHIPNRQYMYVIIPSNYSVTIEKMYNSGTLTPLPSPLKIGVVQVLPKAVRNAENARNGNYLVTYNVYKYSNKGLTLSLKSKDNGILIKIAKTTN